MQRSADSHEAAGELTELGGGREEANAAGAIYGTILVMAVIGGLSAKKSIGAGQILAAVLATTFVFWLAHVYSHMLAVRLEGSQASAWETIRRSMTHEWPMVESALLPALALLLGVIGLVSRDTAVNIAIGTGVAALFVWGLQVGRRLGLPRGLMVLTGLVNCAFGVLLVVLNTLVH